MICLSFCAGALFWAPGAVLNFEDAREANPAAAAPGVHQRGVQSEGGAVDGVSIIS